MATDNANGVLIGTASSPVATQPVIDTSKALGDGHREPTDWGLVLILVGIILFLGIVGAAYLGILPGVRLILSQ